ncbi:MAG: HAD family phosphatase [Phycisphaeraceae bacterium]|nr:HAD family phosphatase [Phycisphaeraceae bacterium]
MCLSKLQGMLNALVFDFDGVIVDSEPLHYRAFVRVAKTLGFEMSWEQYLSEFVGYDDRDAFLAILRSVYGNAIPPDITARLPKLIKDKANAFESEVNQGIEAIPGSIELITELAGKMPIAIASGATQFDIRIILAKLGLDNVFDVTVTADDVEHSKPDPESYAKAVRLLAEKYPNQNITPQTALAIEDTAAGTCSARSAGLQVLGLTTTGSADLLCDAARVIPNLQGITIAQLHQWFA